MMCNDLIFTNSKGDQIEKAPYLILEMKDIYYNIV